MMIIKNLVLFVPLAILCSNCVKETKIPKMSFNLPEESTSKLDTLFRFSEPLSGSFFTDIRSIDALSNGNLIVRNYPDHQLYEFTSNGAFVNLIGNKGRGPGEFQDIYRIYVASNDSLHVVDFNNSRYQVLKKNKSGKWEWKREVIFKHKRHIEVIAQFPREIFVAPNNVITGKFSVTPGSSGNDTLSKNYTYIAKTTHNIEHQGPASRLKPTYDPAIVRKKSSISIRTHENFWKAFYLYNLSRDEVIYIQNNSNRIIGIDSTGEEYVKGYLPFELFSSVDKIVKPSWNNAPKRVQDSYTQSEGLVRRKMLPHAPYYREVFLHKNRLWINLNRSERRKPNWIITTLEGKILESFQGPKKIFSVYIVDDTMYGSILDENKVSYLTGYKLQKLK